MLPELPIELQAEIATYLNTPSLCFFPRTSWRSLRTMQPYLMRHQQHLLRSPPIKLVAFEWGVFCYTSNVIYACGNNRYGLLGLGHTEECTVLALVDQVPLELRQFHALYHQLNALIRLSQTENLLSQPERLNPSGNSLPEAKKSSRTEIDELESCPKRTKFFP